MSQRRSLAAERLADVTDFPIHRIVLAASILDTSDRKRGFGEQESRLLRIMKLAEELGEVNAAVIGATGQNPRKGFSHSWGDVADELADVALTALVALATIEPESWYYDFVRTIEVKSSRLLTGTPSHDERKSNPNAMVQTTPGNVEAERPESGLCPNPATVGKRHCSDNRCHCHRN